MCIQHTSHISMFSVSMHYLDTIIAEKMKCNEVQSMADQGADILVIYWITKVCVSAVLAEINIKIPVDNRNRL